MIPDDNLKASLIHIQLFVIVIENKSYKSLKPLNSYADICIMNAGHIIIHNNHYNCRNYHCSSSEISVSVIFYSPSNGWNRDHGTH